jgi:hypothetical protein
MKESTKDIISNVLYAAMGIVLGLLFLRMLVIL